MDDYDLSLRKARDANAGGQWKLAIEFYSLLVDITPKKWQIINELGDCLLNLESWDKAVETYLLSLEINPEFDWTYHNISVALSGMGNSEEADVYYEKLLQLNPSFPEVNSRDYKVQQQYADFLFRRERWQEAIKYYKNTLSLNPFQEWAHLNLGRSLHRQENLAEAIRVLNEAIEIKEDFTEAQYHLGEIFLDAKEYDKALEKYKSAISLDGDFFHAYQRIGEILTTIGQFDNAFEIFQKVAEIRPEFYGSYLSLGDLYCLKGKWVEAAESYQKSLKLKPEIQEASQKLQRALSNIPSKTQRPRSVTPESTRPENIISLMRSLFDNEWYSNKYPESKSAVKSGETGSIFEFYLGKGARKGHSPNTWFQEEWYLLYYPDVEKCVKSGSLTCGFEHFLATGRYEGRLSQPNLYATLSHKYPEIIQPVGINKLEGIEAKFNSPPVVLTESPHAINILVPTLDSNLIFGGYISILHLLCRLVERGLNVKILICEDVSCNVDLFKFHLRKKERILRAIECCDIFNISDKKKAVYISNKDRFIAYDSWTAITASKLASYTDFNKYFFFIQEYEAIFHSNNSISAIVNGIYRLPHVALFNTQLLANFFEHRKLGVFSGAMENSHIVFEHSLGKLSPPSFLEMSSKKKRSLLFYARPESHAERNLFEIGILGIKLAIKNNIFDSRWSFEGIGTLGAEYDISIGAGVEMKIFSKIPQDKYEQKIRSYDIGLSLMYAPHPSILPFEMAKSGLVVVTNTYENRDENILRGISSNIVPCFPDIIGVANSLKEAVLKVEDFESRIEGANLDWVSDWDETFNDVFFEKMRKFLW